jgi:hypothetical protein
MAQKGVVANFTNVTSYPFYYSTNNQFPLLPSSAAQLNQSFELIKPNCHSQLDNQIVLLCSSCRWYNPATTEPTNALLILDEPIT